MRWLALLTAIALAGCHAVFPYGGSHPAAADTRAPELGVPPGEAGPVDAALSDVSFPTDGGSRSLACVDPKSACSECEPIDTALALCPTACAVGDCDALPDPRDPWPRRCNALRFAEAFCDPTLGAWQLAYADAAALTAPGQAALLVRKGFVEWIALRAERAAGLEESLVEVRWLPPAASRWEFFLVADASADVVVDFDPASARYCKVSRGPKQTYELSAAVRKGGDSDTSTAAGVFADAPAVLQTWVADGEHVCRLIPESGAPPVAVSVAFAGPSPAGGTIALGGLNPDPPEVDPLRFELDYVRAFAPPQ